MTPSPHSSPRLEGLLVDARALEGADLLARMQWLEAVASAVDEAALGSLGKSAARDFRAALGAIIAFARGTRDPEQVDALQATVRTFVARAQGALFGALAASYRDLAPVAPLSDRAACAALAQAFGEARDAIGQGGSVPKAVLDRVAMIAGRRGVEPR